MLGTALSWIVLISIISIGLSLLGMYGMNVFFGYQRQSLEQAPTVTPLDLMPASLPIVSVIIPAYNEAVNIQDCITSILASKLALLHESSKGYMNYLRSLSLSINPNSIGFSDLNHSIECCTLQQ